MLQLSRDQRRGLWGQLISRLEEYVQEVSALPVSPEMDPAPIRKLLASLDLQSGVLPEAAVNFAADALTRWQVHTPHPRYFGLFNPAPTTMGIAADALVAGFNPQMAAWSHSPFAAEAEQFLIRQFGTRFGWAPERVDGTFCSGGMEANHTAVLAALVHRFPEYLDHGARALPGQPMMYVSAEAHHSFQKAARLTGIGSTAVRLIPVDEKLKMRVEALATAVRADVAEGRLPFLIVGTAGTTNAGALDPAMELANYAEANGIWLHVDAAWGGAAAFVPELRPHLAGVERARSITFDAHKWLSVPMGAGVYLTTDAAVLSRTFRVATAYMPKDAALLDVVDPHLHSMQWSRRFIGLKVLLSLMVAGWSGYEQAIRHQTAMGDLLRRQLTEAGWQIVNDTPLPVVCFVDPEGDEERQRAIAAKVVRSGEAWISTTVAGGRTVLRACITHYGTQPEDVAALVDSLSRWATS